MTNAGRKIKIILYRVIFIFLFLSFLWHCFLVFEASNYMPLGPIYSDVAKRVYSPDRTKKALLIRRISGWDLNFIIKIKEGFKTRALLWTGDFEPDMKVDLNERIIWSDDSSFIVLTVDRPEEEFGRRASYDPNYLGKMFYAYDFKDGKKYKPDDKNTIISIMNSRCKKPKLETQLNKDDAAQK